MKKYQSFKRPKLDKTGNLPKNIELKVLSTHEVFRQYLNTSPQLPFKRLILYEESHYVKCNKRLK